MKSQTEIYRKLVEVMSKVGKIAKKGHNDYHNYDYVREADLVEKIRDLLTEVGVAFLTDVVEQRQEEDLSKVKMKFTLVDIESGEFIESHYWGEGQDKGDKGLYKSYTGATKYFLLKTFLIPTNDDPEADESVDIANNRSNTDNIEQIKDHKDENGLRCEECGVSISSGVANYCEQNLDRLLCFDCQPQHKSN
ncbi:MAG: ERF family protein [Halanaerobacter sp.]